MKWLITASVIVVSSSLGFLTAYATSDHGKIIKPKPDINIVGIEDKDNADIIRDYPIAEEPEDIENKEPDENETKNPKVSSYTHQLYKDEDLDKLRSDIGSLDYNARPFEVDSYSETQEKPYRLFLVMGTDVVYSYGGKKVESLNGRTDAILIVKMTDEKIDLVSIPRDSRVYIPGHGYDKINAANVIGGPKLVLKTIESLLKVHIDDYAIVNTFGVAQFVDLFGGIDFNIPKRMKYIDHTAKLYINLYPGMQHLDGRKVHDFLRFRKDGSGDFNRIKRQQEVIKAILSQVVKPSNILKIPQALGIINSNMETNLSTGKMMFLANKLLQMKNLSSNVNVQTLTGYGRMYRRGWYFFLDEQKAQRVMESLTLVPQKPKEISLPSTQTEVKTDLNTNKTETLKPNNSIIKEPSTKKETDDVEEDNNTTTTSSEESDLKPIK